MVDVACCAFTWKMSAHAEDMAASANAATAADEVDYGEEDGGLGAGDGGEVDDTAELQAMLEELEDNQTKIAEASTQVRRTAVWWSVFMFARATPYPSLCSPRAVVKAIRLLGILANVVGVTLVDRVLLTIGATPQVAAQASSAVAAKGKADEEKAARDERSVFVGNVDFGATGEELMSYFSSCGTIERVTILADKMQHPKGFVFPFLP